MNEKKVVLQLSGSAFVNMLETQDIRIYILEDGSIKMIYAKAISSGVNQPDENALSGTQFLKMLETNEVWIFVREDGLIKITGTEVIPSSSNVHQPNEEEMLEEITSLLHELGIPANLKGYNYIRTAILMAVQDVSVLDQITKVCYPQIAKKFNTTTSRAERAIRHAIEVCWKRGNLTVCQQIFGYTYDKGKGKPTNSEFLSLISDKLRIKYHK